MTPQQAATLEAACVVLRDLAAMTEDEGVELHVSVDGLVTLFVGRHTVHASVHPDSAHPPPREAFAHLETET